MMSTFTKDVELSKARAEVARLAVALGMESERVTSLLTDIQALMAILTSDAAEGMHPLLKAAVRGFLKLHPDIKL